MHCQGFPRGLELPVSRVRPAASRKGRFGTSICPSHTPSRPLLSHRESIWLEISETSKSKLQPNTILSTRPWHGVPHPIFPQKPPGSVIAFRCLITPPVKKFFLISNLNLPWHSLKLCSLVLSQIAWEKRLTPPQLQPPFRLLWYLQFCCLVGTM